MNKQGINVCVFLFLCGMCVREVGFACFLVFVLFCVECVMCVREVGYASKK